MIRKCVFCLLLCVLSAGALCASIIETSSFAALKEHADHDTLILIDIDDTILHTKQAFGSDAWFYNKLKELSSTRAYKEAIGVALPLWHKAQEVTGVSLVEENTPSVIAALQDRQYKVMCLTTRGKVIMDATLRQLASLGIDMKRAAPFKGHFPITVSSEYGYWNQGVLFTGGGDKGKTLMSLLEKMAFRPKKILFINDKATHLRDVEKDVEPAGMSFTGLRYNRSDKKKEIREDVAKVQEEYFNKILSDEDALAIIEARRLKA